MDIIKIHESVEISSPVERVFSVVTSRDRRLQLHPSWGTEKISRFSEDYPRPGSRYHAIPVDEEQRPYDTVVTDLQPNKVFAYRSEDERQLQASWTVQDLGESTRLTYEATCLVFESDEEEQRQGLEQEPRQWLGDMKRYLELENSRPGRAFKRVLDSVFLKQRADQRRIILALLAIQFISILTFTAAAIGLGLARFIFP
jgi:uncharacterized protein YndB with AHSA1/START domain